MSLKMAASPPLRRVLVRAERNWRLPDLAAAWHYRELFGVLALRDIKVRYKQTTLGILWAIVQPVGAMIVFTTIAHVAGIGTDGVPAEVFYYCSMLAWLLFANSMTSAGNSLMGSQHLIAKVYFPRLIIPGAAVVTALIDFAVSFVVMLVVLLLYRVPPAPQIVLLPLFVGLAALAGLGFGLWLSALSTQFRDVRHVAPFLTQLWLFCTPVLYSSSAVHGWKRVVLALNPMTAIVDGFRWSIIGRTSPGSGLALSATTVAGVLLSGLVYFQRVERTLADRL